MYSLWIMGIFQTDAIFNAKMSPSENEKPVPALVVADRCK